MFEVACPECRHTLRVPKKYDGKTWRCPDCRTSFVPFDPSRPRPPRPGFFRRILQRLGLAQA